MTLEEFFSTASDFIWGMPLLILLLGGGLFFMIYSRFLPFRYFGHAINVLRGKYDDPDDPGDINHFQALSGALAATIGMGNISGVALAIFAGGPGAIFWMWVSAFFGMATKFFTCTLSVMYRGKDSEGELQGGPMYYIREGLGKNWMPLAIFFSVVGFFGATPVFQANQMVVVIRDTFLEPYGLAFKDQFFTDLTVGLVIAILVAAVILGGIKRIGNVASKLVPAMVILYTASVVIILLINYSEIIPSFIFIFEDAFSAKAALGGAFGMIVIEGAKRAAFSNEAGIGTAPMMHGAAKTKEPVREGLVAMLGPAIDTLLICTMTGLCIIITDVWSSGEANGILLTSSAFAKSLPGVGPFILLICVIIFAITTVFGLAYYGQKCLSFLIGAKYGKLFNYWYIALIIVGSVASLSVVVNIVFVAYGLMSIPTMIGAIFLAPKVVKASKEYFGNVRE
ncbi:alanine/glycine:cation symporter family protein [Marinoscillum pacificum]|uniref:alanine/glycine:cation symporter family protein n=1 Tax=Marinoscillum pacificum TaxID=392723 RepID=UPI002157549D|nr:alanine/glycine:cation symporter family protein [Marinoscillum pacificum]